jgi:hypothetical protein
VRNLLDRTAQSLRSVIGRQHHDDFLVIQHCNFNYKDLRLRA